MYLLIFICTNKVAVCTHRSHWLNVCKMAFHQQLANALCVCRTASQFYAHSVWEQSGLSEQNHLLRLFQHVQTLLIKLAGYSVSPLPWFQLWPWSGFEVFVSKTAIRENCTFFVINYYMTYIASNMSIFSRTLWVFLCLKRYSNLANK